MTDTANTGQVQERQPVALSPSTVAALKRLGFI